MAKFSEQVALSSLPGYALWRLRNSGDEVSVLLKNGMRILLRGTSHDSHVANEIFVQQQYAPPPHLNLTNIRSIVDIGANVGFACVYLLGRFSQARVMAFEPHPNHIKQIHRHVALNQLKDRVTLIEGAAGVQTGQIQFLDDGSCSATVNNKGEGTTMSERVITVPLIDVFDALPTGTIDLLKLDAEGAEYDIMGDGRFSEVARRTRFLVMEWHNTGAHTDGRSWCVEKLKTEGFDVHEGSVQYGIAGSLWAARQA